MALSYEEEPRNPTVHPRVALNSPGLRSFPGLVNRAPCFFSPACKSYIGH
jgi:hypothetical protein